MNDTDHAHLAGAFVLLRRELLVVQARALALEELILNAVPEPNRSEWRENTDLLAAKHYQLLLERVEDYSPSLAAELDDREPGGLF